MSEITENKNLPHLDKTELIDRVIRYPSQVILFNRPYGFGKSVNMSMLDCCFNVQPADTLGDVCSHHGHPAVVLLDDYDEAPKDTCDNDVRKADTACRCNEETGLCWI